MAEAKVICAGVLLLLLLIIIIIIIIKSGLKLCVVHQ